MKIAFCLENPIAQAGGVSVLVLALIRELAADCQITLVSADTPESLANANLGQLIQGHIPWSSRNPTRETARALVEQISARGVDLAHFHFGGNFGWSNRRPSRCPIPLLAKRGVPVVTTIHMAVALLDGYCGSEKPLWFKLGLLPAAWFNKLRVLRHVRREITVSRKDYDRLRCWYWPLRGRIAHIYHSRIKDSVVTGDQARREPRVLAVGHFAPRKGQTVLAEAFAKISARHPEWTLQLAGHFGDGNCRRRVEQLAAQLASGKIEMLGQRDDAFQLMQRAAIYVQPSFYEGLPLSLQEALWQGCASIATCIPGNVELVEHERSGLLVPPGDPAALAAALERLMSDASLRQRLATNGHGDVLNRGMTVAQMTRNHRQLYADVLAAR